MGTEDCFRGIKRQGREAGHSPACNAEVKKSGDFGGSNGITSVPNFIKIGQLFQNVTNIIGGNVISCG
jgi:hypothetical protein